MLYLWILTIIKIVTIYLQITTFEASDIEWT